MTEPGSLEAIETRLRTPQHEGGSAFPEEGITGNVVCVTLDDALAAVREARAATVQEIVDALASDHTDLNIDLAGHRHIANERKRCSRWVARRFASLTGEDQA